MATLRYKLKIFNTVLFSYYFFVIIIFLLLFCKKIKFMIYTKVIICRVLKVCFVHNALLMPLKLMTEKVKK